MEIEQHIWGMTPEGEAIILYTMRNASGSEVQISTYGAAVVSIKVPDRTGRIDDVALGYKRFEDYFGDPASCGKTLGRCAGRIAYGRMEIEGTERRFELNNSMNHLNGGTKGFGNRLWEGRVETNRIVMSLLSEDGEQGYPGELAAEAIFDFGDENTLEITYLARTERTTIVNLATNLYLNLAGESSGSILGHELRLNSRVAPEMNEQRIPTGQMLDTAGTAQDFASFRPLGANIQNAYNHIRDLGGYDHLFLLDGWQANILTLAAELREPRSGRCVSILTSQPYIHLATGNQLAGGCPESKSGQRYDDHAGVAITAQNLLYTAAELGLPAPLLHPGELYCQKTVYRFGLY